MAIKPPSLTLPPIGERGAEGNCWGNRRFRNLEMKKLNELRRNGKN
jgi:hypothetical protein